MQRIYGFVQEEDGVVSRLLTEISAYFEYLARQHGDYVAFHNVKIPMEGYMAQLARVERKRRLRFLQSWILLRELGW